MLAKGDFGNGVEGEELDNEGEVEEGFRAVGVGRGGVFRAEFGSELGEDRVDGGFKARDVFARVAGSGWL